MSLTEAEIEEIVERKVQERLHLIKPMQRTSCSHVTRATHEYIVKSFADSGLAVQGWREYAQRDVIWSMVKLSLNKKSAHAFWAEEDLEKCRRVVDDVIQFIKSQREERHI